MNPFVSLYKSLLKVRPKFGNPSYSRFTCYGIPKLFRWLTEQYPSVIESYSNFQDRFEKVDNLYLDMNGIIHACTHSNEEELVAFDEKEMFLKIFDYTDRLFQMIQPKRLLFLAIDGVAPRAKMNQQRSRRFRAAKEREALISQLYKDEGETLEYFDSNAITPGTEFMHRLSSAFRTWIEYKMKTDRKWQTGVEVIFSGPDVSGEGEHKIMEYIRYEQSIDRSYRSKNYWHCMYGLDADLIMLSLVTHEKNFVLLREKYNFRRSNSKDNRLNPERFDILQLEGLRKMLELEFSSIQQGNTVPEIERIVDDFVFM